MPSLCEQRHDAATKQICTALESLASARQCLERDLGMLVAVQQTIADAVGATNAPVLLSCPLSMQPTPVACTDVTVNRSLPPPTTVDEGGAGTADAVMQGDLAPAGGDKQPSASDQNPSQALKRSATFQEMIKEAEEFIGASNILGPHEAKEFLEANPDALYLDVQEAGAASVPGTHRASLGELFEKASSEQPDLADPVIAERDKGAPILVTCSMGRQAKLGAKLLVEYGFTNVKTVEGGCMAWKAAMMNHPITLPLGWPQTVKRRFGFGDDSECIELSGNLGRDFRHCRSTTVTLEEGTSTVDLLSSGTSLGKDTKTTKLRYFVLSPASRLRIALDLLSVLALAFDLITVPWLLAWDVPIEGWLRSCSLTLATFWSVDILANFRTGFYTLGEVQMNPGLIAMRYLRTWFVPDFLMVVLDWVSIVLLSQPLGSRDMTGREEGNTLEVRIMGILRFTKWSRLLRLVSMARFVRFSDVVERIMDRTSQSPYALIAFQVFRLLFVIVYVNHFGACVWWAIGRIANSNTGARWVNQDVEYTEYLYTDADPLYQYATCLHWAVTQILAGSMQVNAVNTAERLFSVACLIFGVLFFSSLVSMLTSKMTQLRVMHQGRTAKLYQLRDFLRNKGVAPELAMNITKQVSSALFEKRPDTPSDLKAWPLISKAHKDELHRELCMPHLVRHSFFLLVGHIEAKLLTRLCDKAVHLTVHSQHEVVFLPGVAASETYMVISGHLRYSQDPETSMIPHPVVRDVNPGTWVCEAALWTWWTTVGTLEAAQVCELLVIKAEKTIEVLQRNIHVCQVGCEYGRAVFQRVCAARPPASDWPSDICLPFTSHGEVMASLSCEVRAFTGLLALQSLLLRASWMPWQTRLRKDICEGRRTAVLTVQGDVECILVTVAVRLLRIDGKVLSLLGIWDGQHAVPAGPLPSTQLQENELPRMAMRRLLHEQLAPLEDFSRLGRYRCDTVERREGTFCLPERVVCTDRPNPTPHGPAGAHVHVTPPPATHRANASLNKCGPPSTEYDAQLDAGCTLTLPLAETGWSSEMTRTDTKHLESLPISEVLVVAGSNDSWHERQEVSSSCSSCHSTTTTLRLLAWLEPGQHGQLSSAQGQVALKRFLSSVSVSQTAAEKALAFSANNVWRGFDQDCRCEDVFPI